MPSIIINHHSMQVCKDNNHILLSKVRLLLWFKRDVLWDFTQRNQMFPAFFLDCLTLEDGTERLNWIVTNKLPFYTV